jgi:hypothetical protein
MADGSRSSSVLKPSKALPASWVRWVMPSAADLIFVALLCVLAFTQLSTRLLGDAGIGWHIRTGQQILATHTIPRVDPFSSTMGGKPWIAWEWLYDLAVGQLEAGPGLNGVIWLTAVVVAAVFAWTFHILVRRETNLFVALVLVLLAISAAMIHFHARPHVLTWLFALAWFRILSSTEEDCLRGKIAGRGWLLWFLPASMVLWANLHGGFLLGFVLLAIFWIGTLWGWLTTRETNIEASFQRIALGKHLRLLTGVGLVSALATLINPYGWKLHQHILAYLSNSFFMDHIDEFQSPNFHGIAQKCFLALLLLTFGVLAARGREFRMSQTLVVLFAMCSGLYASRNIPVSSILLVLVVGPSLPKVDFGGFVQRMGAVDAKLRGHVWPVVAIIFVLLVAMNQGRIGSSFVMDAHFDPKRMPVDAVNYIEQHSVGGPILSPDYWGGYVIYRVYPRAKVVIDDRHDFYGADFLYSYLKMLEITPGWDDFLKEHEVGCIVLPKSSVVAAMLAETPGWKAIYADDVAIIFVGAN